MNVSVIIPAYNEEEYLGACLTSLTKQTVAPYEIIVIDNNSHDATAAIAKSYKGVRVIREKRQGMIAARNRGFSSAKSEIIARCDADTILPENWIAAIKENFREHDMDALTGPIGFYDLTIQSPVLSSVYLKMSKPILHGNDVLLGPNMMIKKAMWRKIKDIVCLDDRLVHEDIDLSLHITEVGGKILFDDSLVIQASGRRIRKNPLSFFGEYPLRFIKTLLAHRDQTLPFFARKTSSLPR